MNAATTVPVTVGTEIPMHFFDRPVTGVVERVSQFGDAVEVRVGMMTTWLRMDAVQRTLQGLAA